jgi:sec-independent protein translocase protein TatA
MLAFLEGPDLIIVAVIVLVIFGGSKIPQLARSLGEAQREFKKGLSTDGTAKATATETTGGSAPGAADAPDAAAPNPDTTAAPKPDTTTAPKLDTTAQHEADQPS